MFDVPFPSLDRFHFRASAEFPRIRGFPPSRGALRQVLRLWTLQVGRCLSFPRPGGRARMGMEDYCLEGTINMEVLCG
jgi:hypothetical protein